ncbi:SgcJ/EcaC family oxidoreductase [Nocardia sp. CDC159]|uniref:SgcJ/EcaC family oxidoreductase n=1 Tax=Nocardia pulmonis TaxID=2951408 RepID=A0A9X2J1B6_9NOCA|nr:MULTISPECIES: SgcJ/EcaC family oxidoreductase [Nocardia]MCM6776816.1 SgcJ/EcaC family oxidoreductase [Nocardia pulmonis]MCM6789035.1 SgcJ/EcaC family oxidoreductase [Nocardia sp. CDC159]
MNTAHPIAPSITDTTVDHTGDIAAIRAIIGRVESGYNTNDAELMTADFLDNATVVNAMGTLLTGRAELLESSRAGLAGFLKDEYVRYDTIDITFLRPDVAIAHKHARATTPDGDLIDQEPAMIALYVLIKEDGRWWAAARQNTPISRPA